MYMLAVARSWIITFIGFFPPSSLEFLFLQGKLEYVEQLSTIRAVDFLKLRLSDMQIAVALQGLSGCSFSFLTLHDFLFAVGVTFFAPPTVRVRVAWKRYMLLLHH